MLANPHSPPLIAIEEPDAGLHPTMPPIVADYAKEASTRSQIVFTTHSPTFLDAFREDPTTVVECHEGQTQLKVLSSDDLTYWLKEYTLGELYRSGELEAVE